MFVLILGMDLTGWILQQPARVLVEELHARRSYWLLNSLQLVLFMKCTP